MVPRQSLKNKASASQRAVRQREILLSPRRPYGFRLEPEPGELDIVRRIFTWHAEGLSLREIAGRLNEARVPTKKRAAGGWQAETIRLILNNRELYGPHLRG